MKYVVRLALALGFFCLAARAQSFYGIGPGVYSFGTITGVGYLGSVIAFNGSVSSPSNHSLDFSITGTPPKSCLYELMGSLDGQPGHFASLSGALDCTGSPTATGLSAQIFYNIYHIPQKPVPYVALHILAYTPGDATTVVTSRYVRGN